MYGFALYVFTNFQTNCKRWYQDEMRYRCKGTMICLWSSLFCFRRHTRAFPRVNLFSPPGPLWKILFEPFCRWRKWNLRAEVCDLSTHSDHGRDLQAFRRKGVLNIGNTQVVIRTVFKASNLMNPLWSTWIVFKNWDSNVSCLRWGQVPLLLAFHVLPFKHDHISARGPWWGWSESRGFKSQTLEGDFTSRPLCPGLSKTTC